MQIAAGGNTGVGSAKTLPCSLCQNLKGRAERDGTGRPEGILGLLLSDVEHSWLSCTVPALVRAGTSSHKGLGKKDPSACGWLLHTQKLDPSGKNCHK